MKLKSKDLLSTLSVMGTLVLAGCNGSGISSSERIISSGWAGVSNEDSEGQPPLYCYKTLAEPDCYDTPDSTRSGQLVSVYPAKQTARPIGVQKIIRDITDRINGSDDDPDQIQERRLDQVRYYPTPEEKALSKSLEKARRTQETNAPLKLN